MSGSRVRLIVGLWLTSVLVAGCGDDEVCGVYAGGNVGVIKQCDTTSTGSGSELDDQQLAGDE